MSTDIWPKWELRELMIKSIDPLIKENLVTADWVKNVDYILLIEIIE